MWVNFELCLSPPRTQQCGSYMILIKKLVVLIVLLSFYFFSKRTSSQDILVHGQKKMSLLNIRHRNVVQFYAGRRPPSTRAMATHQYTQHYRSVLKLSIRAVLMHPSHIGCIIHRRTIRELK